jgi:hypothetical protein
MARPRRAWRTCPHSLQTPPAVQVGITVEKVIHAVFLKLGLGWETAVHKRVKAVLLYLAETPP